MPPDRRRLIVLLTILLGIGGIAVWRYWQTSGGVEGGAGQSSASAARRSAGASRVTAPEVHLRALDEDKERPENAGGRDLFRFRPKAPPPPPPSAAVAPPPANTVQNVPPPAIPAIALRFIGLVEAQAQRIAILSDGRAIYQGREGDIIEGRYRILRIGVESIDMAYVDGTGRQTIRLSGS